MTAARVAGDGDSHRPSGVSPSVTATGYASPGVIAPTVETVAGVHLSSSPACGMSSSASSAPAAIDDVEPLSLAVTR